MQLRSERFSGADTMSGRVEEWKSGQADCERCEKGNLWILMPR